MGAPGTATIREPVLDTVALRVMAFAHPDGIGILLAALGAPRARFPAEVYNGDEDSLAPGADDLTLSELARGLRYARREATARPVAEAERYLTWIRNAGQLPNHIARQTLLIDPLTTEELPLREELRDRFGIGRGEAASLVLARRHGTQVVFLSSDVVACDAAADVGLPYLTLKDVLEAWVSRSNPTASAFDTLVEGMRVARFGLPAPFTEELRRRTSP